MPDERYYTADDPEHGVTLDQLGELPEAEQRTYVLHWWHRNFEDPANETPYESAEGGYIYIWGGPYEALGELEDEFSSAIPFERLERYAREIESDGTFDWAPGPDHPDHKRASEEYEAEHRSAEEELRALEAYLDGGQAPALGGAAELAQRAALAERVSALEAALAELRPQHGGIGHNNPPRDVIDPASPEVVDAGEAAEEIRAALNANEPDARTVAQAAGRLARFVDWLRAKGDLAADEAAKVVGKAAGVGIVVAIGGGIAALAELAAGAVSAAISWLQLVVLPF